MSIQATRRRSRYYETQRTHVRGDADKNKLNKVAMDSFEVRYAIITLEHTVARLLTIEHY